MLQQQYCLRWKYHHSNLQTMFSSLLDRGCFCDVTLACEEQIIRAHRVVLCACSTYFDSVLTNHASEKDPIIIMKDAKFSDIKCLVEFMYRGEINVEHENLASLLKTAEELKIKGLAEVSWRHEKATKGGGGMGPDGAAHLSAEAFEAGGMMRNNIYVKTFNNSNASTLSPNMLMNFGSSGPPHPHPSSSPNLMMYPKVSTPVSLAQIEQLTGGKGGGGSQALQMSPFHHPMHAVPPIVAQMHQQQQPQAPPGHSIPQLTPIRIQPGSVEPSPPYPVKKKRGRPPLDGEFENYTSQMTVMANEQIFVPIPDSTGATTCTSVDQATAPAEDFPEEQQELELMDIVKIEQPDTPEPADFLEYDSDSRQQQPVKRRSKKRSRQQRRDEDYVHEEEEEPEQDNESTVSEDKVTGQVMLTTQELEEWRDVVKMEEYLVNGRRPQFWEEHFTKRVLEAIKNKNLEMKKAASVLGVSYGTLYGRYREVYGCLKDPFRYPNSSRAFSGANMWSQVDQNPADILNMLQRSAITMSMRRPTTGNNSSSSANEMDPLESCEYQGGHQSLQKQLKNQGVTLISE